MIKRILVVILRVLAVLLIGVVSAVIGFIAGVIIIGTLSPLVEMLFGYTIMFNGREGYEAGGPIGFLLGALVGLVGSAVFLFRRRAAK